MPLQPSDVTLVSPPRRRLYGAIVVHLLMLPVWIVLSMAGLILGLSSVSPDTAARAVRILGPEATGWLWPALHVAVWVWLAFKLVRWWREGRTPLWPYPLAWIIGVLLTTLFHILFALLLLLPPVRRALTPKPAVLA